MNVIKTCCILSHKPNELPYSSDETCPQYKLLKNAIKNKATELIEQHGYAHFICGLNLGIDMSAAEIILELQANHPGITLECALACGTQQQEWNNVQQSRYYHILEQSSKVTLLQFMYTEDCLQKQRNYLVSNSDCIMVILDSFSGETADVIFAMGRQKDIICIDPNTCHTRVLKR